MSDQLKNDLESFMDHKSKFMRSTGKPGDWANPDTKSQLSAASLEVYGRK
jgi:hypothetical protein